MLEFSLDQWWQLPPFHTHPGTFHVPRDGMKGWKELEEETQRGKDFIKFTFKQVKTALPKPWPFVGRIIPLSDVNGKELKQGFGSFLFRAGTVIP